MNQSSRSPSAKLGAEHPWHLLIAAVLLAAMFGLVIGSSLQTSLTFDEGYYLARGWAFLKTGHLMPLGHPPLTNVLSGLGVLLEPGLPDPTTLTGWAANNADWFSQDLLWNQGINTTRVLFLARFANVLLGLLLGALVYRWGRELYGRWSALLALVLIAFSPSVIAHTGLATTDLGVALFFTATVYAWMRYLRWQRPRWFVISGVMFGLAQASKFSALVLIPILTVMTLWIALRRGPLMLPRHADQTLSEGGTGKRIATALGALILMGLIGVVAVWATYLFRVSPYPLGLYVAEFRHFLDLAAEGHRAYLLGRFSDTGWWYYHPFVLIVKLPVTTLLLLVLAITLALGRHMHAREWQIVFPALAYLGFTMTGSLNVGVRYLLPLLPFVALFASRIVHGRLQSGLLRPVIVGALTVVHVLVVMRTYPNYVSYFNFVAGGSENGYKVLADSNVDWGQDLPGLADFLRERGITTPIYLSYFGKADPAYYGINYIPLPGWPPPPADSDRPPFNPMNPAPGLYAISASNLVGVQLYNPDAFGYFRTRQPIAVIGHSIFVYEVQSQVVADGEKIPWFAQCAAPQPSETEDRLKQLTGLDDLRYVYFDCREVLPFPEGPGWLLVQEGFQPVIDLGNPTYLAREGDGAPRYSVWQVNGPPPAPEATVDFPSVALPLPIAGAVELLGYNVDASSVPQGGTLTVTEWWRVREPPPPPISIFAHLLYPDNSLLVAGDGLGLPAESWMPGMVLVQQHRFEVPPDAVPQSYALSVGLYSLSTGERFVVSQSGDRVIDRVVLRTVDVIVADQR